MVIKKDEKETPLRFTNIFTLANILIALRTHFYTKINQNLNTSESELKLNLLLIFHQFYILPPHYTTEIRRSFEKGIEPLESLQKTLLPCFPQFLTQYHNFL